MIEILKAIWCLFFKKKYKYHGPGEVWFDKETTENIYIDSPELPYKHLIKSETAERLGIDNTPNDEQIKNLQQLNIKIYIPIKLDCEKDGKTLILNSGFRSEALNKAVGGSPNSDHCRALAVDVSCDNNEYLFNVIKTLNLPFKQLIKEDDGRSKWCHVSLDLNDIPRKQCLEAYMENGQMKYRSI